MGSGFLLIHATVGDEALPVMDARVQIFDKDSKMLYETTTDANGLTRTFSVPAPDVSLTLDPTYTQPAYSTVNVVVSAPGFITEHINGVEIVDTQTAKLPVRMKPLADESNPITDNTINISPLAVVSEEPFAKRGDSVQGLSSRVLSQVIIPDYIIVHLGAPSDTSARNVRVKFADYVKNVASSEIYSTWPHNSLVANIHAIVTFALNRVFTEWYRTRGYNFDITNSTVYDMAYREGAGVFQNISQIVDEIFNVYAHRFGFMNPYFTSFCNGSTVTCAGMSQWGTVSLANQGRTPLEILRHYYPDDLILTASTNITGITESFPGNSLTVGSNGASVQRMQNFLNRIRINYPLIPRIDSPDGTFGADTAEAVRVFQKIFNLTPDGIIDRATWNKISSIYVGITELAELNSEGERISIGKNPPNVTLSQGSRGKDVLELQFILNTIATYYSEIQTVIQDSLFDARDRNSVIEFQKIFGLTPDGIVGPVTWNKLYAVYRGIGNNVVVPPVPPVTPPLTPNVTQYPGVPLKIGSVGSEVRMIQEYLNTIRTMYPNIPELVVEGSFGPETQRAVIAFQQQFLLTPDGIVGPVTWDEIMEQYKIAKGNVISPPTPPDNFEYIVLPGDSLWKIALKFKTTVNAIKTLNELKSDIINIGQVLKISQSGGTTSPLKPSNYFEHTVQSGDTLWILAQRFGTTVNAIKTLNNLNSDRLNIGQVLRIPQSGVSFSKTVVIDAGHGGPNPGAVSGNRLEKTDNLNLALAVQKNLQAQGQNVVMTRTTDVDVPLIERSEISNRNNADLFVSLHRNANIDPAVNGVDTFVQIDSPPINTTYAQNVQSEIVNVGVQNDRGVQQENFSVLRNTKAPAMLVEMGFITNEKDNQLFDQNFEAYAAAITRGIMKSLTD